MRPDTPLAGKPGMYYWHWRKWLGDRHGQPCRVLATGRMNSALVQFVNDGYKVITSRYAVRKATGVVGLDGGNRR